MVTPVFKEVHAIMSEMQAIFMQTKIKPVNHSKSYTVLEYYSSLTEFDR
jgi:hypothetical protein